MWGKDSHDTEDAVKEAIRQPGASVAAIGPAGENLCAGAMIENDKNHSMSHSGIGSVMGAKKLKAIAVSGKKTIPVANGKRIDELSKEWVERITRPGQRMSRMTNQHSKRTEYRSWLPAHGFAGKNFRINQFSEYGLGMAQQNYTAKPCPRCPIGCPYDVEIMTGPHKGYVATLSGGGEALEGAGALLGITEPGAVFRLADLFDRLGVEGSMAGCSLAMAIEAFEKGLLTSNDTDGLELSWGDAEAAEKLFRKYVGRDGIGDVLAKGVRQAAEIIGGDATSFAVHVKGSAINLHDWRANWGLLFGQIVGSGAGWPAPGADGLTREPDLGYDELTNPFDPRLKPMEARETGILKFANDSTGLCWLITWGLPDALSLTADSISAATGWDIDPQELLVVGERIMHLERAFNVKCGLTPKDDYDVSPRLIEAPDGGPGKGKTMAPYLRGMTFEYYRLMGWDEKTGKPWRSTLNRLGLEDVAKDLWG